jgi:hypothetical protein
MCQVIACIPRSSHLEEYSRMRPASAGSRPRTLLNKLANVAATVQVDDDPDPADAEPWVLEGWGEGPSVVSDGDVGSGWEGHLGLGACTDEVRCGACVGLRCQGVPRLDDSLGRGSGVWSGPCMPVQVARVLSPYLESSWPWSCRVRRPSRRP